MQLDKTKHPMLITILVTLLGVTGMLATDIYAPALPDISVYFGAGHALVKLTISMYLLGVSLSPLLFGAWSEKYGRKPILLFFSCIAFVGTLLAALSVNIETLIMARVIQGLGFGIVTALTRVVFVDLFTGTKLIKVASYISFFITFAPAIAPVLGSHVQHYFGWQACFYFLAGYLVLNISLIAWLVPETIAQKNPSAAKFKEALKNYQFLIKSRRFTGYALSSGIAFAVTIVFFNLSPFIFQDQLHLSVIQYGWITALITCMVLVSRIINIPLVKYLNPHLIIALGLAVITLSSGFLLLFALLNIHSIFLITFSMMIIILGTGVIFPNATALALSAYRHISGIAGALYASLQTFSAFLAGLLASVLDNSVLSMAVFLFAMGFLGVIVFWVNCIKEGSQKSETLFQS